MSREKKKGTSGNAKAFITRARAIKKLQVSIPEFRRLCILKGIYPRDPKKKVEGHDKTYYLRKDIDFLAHERLIGSIRAENAHKKKVVKARGKRRIDVLRRLALSRPQARLDHLVLERYPQFEDAVRELDDPLCVIGLFANLPADHKVGIAPKRVANCQRLLKEFHQFVAGERSLKRVFVSIKGYYLQARVVGELVTWVLPHRFCQVLPADVDYSVMLTFLELYECILSFVNFRLYTGANMAYPPKISRVADAKGLELAAMEVRKVRKGEEDNLADIDQAMVWKKVSTQTVQKTQELAMTAPQEEEEEEEEEEDENQRDIKLNGGEVDGKKIEGKDICEASEEGNEDEVKSLPYGVFAERSFVLGREVPYVELEFMLKACGAARVTREDDLSEEPDRLAAYTHWIVDRPKIVGERNMSLEYVQPQYIFDSINAGLLLPTSLYAPGGSMPPHLSPFVSDEDDGGYRPWFKDVLEKIKAGDASVIAEAAAVVYAEGSSKAKQVEESEGRKQTPGAKTVLVGDKKETTGTADGKVSKAMEVDKSKNDGEVENPRKGQGSKNEKGNVAGDDEELRDDVTGDDCGIDDEDGAVMADDDESDEEGEEEEMERVKETKSEQEGKEMATLMLSRKKKRLYGKHKREEDAKAAVRDKLVSKRKQLESERGEVPLKKTEKKRRKRA